MLTNGNDLKTCAKYQGGNYLQFERRIYSRASPWVVSSQPIFTFQLICMRFKHTTK